MPLQPLLRRRWLATVAVLVALLATGAAPAGAQLSSEDPDDIETPEVRELRITGMKVLDKDDLKKSIATEESHCRSLLLKPICLISKARYFYEREYLDRTELRRDVLRIKVFYYKRGYRDTRVDTTITEAGDKVRVHFRITEGPPTRLAVVRAGPDDAPLSVRDRQRLVSLRAGQPLNLLSLDSSRARLRDAMWERGYGDATVEVETSADDSARTARVAFLLVPGKPTTVGEIRIEGNDEISQRTIRNSLTFEEGDVYRRSDVIRSQRSLYESGLFRRAALDTAARPDSGGSADSVKAVVVTVVEAPERGARLSAGFNTLEFVQVEGRFSHYNWFGGARRLDITGSVGNLLARQLNDKGIFKDVMINAGDDRARYFAPTWQASADIRQPWFQGPQNTIGLSVFGHRRSAPGIFVDHGYGTSATFTREFSERAPLSANYRFEITRVDAGDVYFCVNYGVCEIGTIDALRDRQRLSPFTITGSWDRTNNPLARSRGFLLRATLEHASAFTVSDFRYNRALFEGSYYRRIGKGSVLAARLRGGWVRALHSTEEAVGAEALHPRKRFYAGGSQSVRGYGENQLGPRVLTIPAERLRGGAGEYCPEPTPLAECGANPTAVDENGEPIALEDADFTPRPVGGNALFEANLEYRVPVWSDKLLGAVFVDGASVGGLSGLLEGTGKHGAVTPGVGVRYRSPIGNIRFDVGYHPKSVQRLPVVTEEVTATGARRLVTLNKCEPDTEGNSQCLRSYTEGRRFRDRLTVHLSIGEAF